MADIPPTTDCRSLEEAESYCRRISEHYENFTVGSLFFPKKMRQDLTNFYAFCRYSDDLGDEGDTLSADGRQKAAAKLDVWTDELELCDGGKPSHPILIALQGTIQKYNLPLEPFRNLIEAFKQDQFKQRYSSYEGLLEYCRHSANPVGRIYLMLFGYREESMFQLSDKICSGLQLTNFWQDVSVDLQKGRIYLPIEDIQKFGCSIHEIERKKYDSRFRKLMKFEVDRTWNLFKEGADLEKALPKKLALEIKLFRKGGEAVLKKIERMNYNVLIKRPALTGINKGSIFLKTIISTGLGVGR